MAVFVTVCLRAFLACLLVTGAFCCTFASQNMLCFFFIPLSVLRRCRLDPLEEGRLKVLRLPERRVKPPTSAFGLLPLVPQDHPEVPTLGCSCHVCMCVLSGTRVRHACRAGSPQPARPLVLAQAAKPPMSFTDLSAWSRAHLFRWAPRPALHTYHM